MLAHAGAPPKLWGYAMKYAVYILNRLPYKQGSKQTRVERWTGRTIPTPHKHVRVWGCTAWKHEAHPTGPHLDKLAPRSKRHILLGFNDNYTSYVLGELPYYKTSFSALCHFR